MAVSSQEAIRIGLIVGSIAALVIILFLGGLLFWCKGRKKGFKCEVFVDVAGLSFVLVCELYCACICLSFP